ncbi:MAG TPA: amidohydrolase family protein [Thermodesulfobacteriota bacterium]
MTETRLVRGRWVLTGPADPVLADGAVAVTGDRIAEVGPYAALRARHPAAEVLGGDGVAVLPGLVDAHHHAGGATVLQHGVADDHLEPWLLALGCRRPGDPFLDAVLTAGRLLRSGVTSVVDMTSGAGPADAFAAELRRSLEGYDAAGIRVALAPGFAEQSHLVAGPGEDERFLATLPPDLRAEASRLVPAAGTLDADDYLGIVEDLRRAYRDHPRLEVWFGPPGPHWTSDGTWARIAEAAARLDTRIQTHVAESLREKLVGPRAYGAPVLLHLRDLGVLSPRLSIAHGVWLTGPEIAALAESGASLAHNPSSNLRLRAGVGPLNALLAAGVTVAIGLDANGLDDDDDLLREMRVALRLHRTPHLGGPAPTVADVLGMATTGGARLLGKADRLGRLAAGLAADLVLVDLERITRPWVAPEADPRALLVLRAQARDVRCVLVGGEVVLADGRPTRFDEAEAARELAGRLAAAPCPAEAASLARRLAPRLVAYYRGWES